MDTSTYEEKRAAILKRIKIYYSKKLGREVSDEETNEIAENLKSFAEAILLPSKKVK